jgi:short-subunit dehydrogenase
VITPRRRSLRGRRVVVVGATSGVGRATALLLASEGCRLLLAARSDGDLAGVAVACRSRGAELVVTEAVDIARAEDVQRLEAAARRHLGGADIWINTASVLLAGDLTVCPVAELEQLVAVNLTGTVLTTRAALTLFDEQGHGTLINTSSLLGLVTNPLVPVYCATKAAIRQLTMAVRRSPRPRAVRICVVLPGPIDTPIFASAGNHTGRPLRAIPPAASPWRVAAAIVRCARRPRRTTTTGVTGWGLLAAHRLAPRLTDWGVARYSGALLTRAGHVEPTSGAILATTGTGRADGGWRRGRSRSRLGDLVGRRLAHGR